MLLSTGQQTEVDETLLEDPLALPDKREPEPDKVSPGLDPVPSLPQIFIKSNSDENSSAGANVQILFTSSQTQKAKVSGGPQ